MLQSPQSSQPEVWATYSVTDHIRTRRFIADVMLYDRLVFPVPLQVLPPTAPMYLIEEPVLDRTEWQRWEDNNWDPYKQNLLLKVLGEIAVRVPWDERQKELWRKRRTTLDPIAKQAKDEAFIATRYSLAMQVPAYVRAVASLGPSYPSLAALTREVPFRRDLRRFSGADLHAMLGRQFIVIDESRRSQEYQLEVALDFALDPDFRAKRRQLIAWEQRFLTNGSTDGPSMVRAVEEMQTLIAAEQATLTSMKRRMRTRLAWGYKLVKVVVPVGAELAGIPHGAALAEAMIGLVALGGGDDLFTPKPGYPSPAAFFISASQIAH